jgi:hypothetical protein
MNFEVKKACHIELELINYNEYYNLALNTNTIFLLSYNAMEYYIIFTVFQK